MFSLNAAQTDRNTCKILKLSTKEMVSDKTNCHILQVHTVFKKADDS